MKFRLHLFRPAAAIASIAMSAVLLSQTFGLFPDRDLAILDARKCLIESVAVYSSSAAQRDDWESLRSVLFQIGERNPDVLSIGVRRADGELAVAWKDHVDAWGDRSGGQASTETHMQVPILKDAELWGTVEIAYPPIAAPFWSWPAQSVRGTIGFVILFVFGGSWLYLRRILPKDDEASPAAVPHRVKAAMDTLAEGVLILDKDRRIALANQAFADMVGVESKSLHGMSADELPWVANPRSEDELLPWERSLAVGETQTGVILGIQNGLAPIQSLSVNATPIFGDDGSQRGAMATFDNLTPLERKNTALGRVLRRLRQSRNKVRIKNEELKLLALRDALTGAYNRRSLFVELEKLWQGGDNFSVVMVDVDHFKSINDRYGHSVGDQVLQGVAKCLRETTGDAGMVCRFGGEEFCVLLPQIGVELARTLAESLRQGLAARRIGDVAVTASFGVSSRELQADSIPTLMDQADKALYGSKKTGRNRVMAWGEVPAALLLEKADANHPAKENTPKSNRPAEGVIGETGVESLFALLQTSYLDVAMHSRRVAELSGELAQGLMTSREIRALKMAALVHDIGKVCAGGALTGPEASSPGINVAQLSEQVLRAAFDSDLLARIVRNAQAWYSESATQPEFPHGLAIPIASRILAVADTFDTLTSDHGGRPGLSAERAIAEMRRKAGTRFDPSLIGRLSLMAEQLEVRTQHSASHAYEPKTLPPRVASFDANS
jgi:diguanylate cyclase (GGDEF)-like protein